MDRSIFCLHSLFSSQESTQKTYASNLQKSLKELITIPDLKKKIFLRNALKINPKHIR